MNINRLKWILWDLDDTLYAPIPGYIARKRILFVESYQHAVGGDMSFDQAELELKRKLVEADGLILRIFKNLGVNPRDVLQRMADIDRTTLFTKDTGLPVLFDELEACGLQHALITNNIRYTTRDILNLLGLSPERFEFEITMDDVRNIKPDPEPFQRFLELSGAQPEQCVMVGDVPASDCIPAKHLGMHTILVRKRPAVIPSEVDIYLDDIYGIPQALKEHGLV